MTKRFGKLPRAEREKIEVRYHRMKPQKLDEVISRAKRHAPSAIRLPAQLVKALKSVAESEGESEYQVMVRRWIEERLQQKTSTVD